MLNVLTISQSADSIAAQNLHIAQPSLSLAIKQLEQELNIVIFIRSRKGTFFCKKGKIIYQKTQKISEYI